MNILEFFYDYECPFCKHGYELLLEQLPLHPGISVVWRPCEGHPRPEDWHPHTDLAIQGFYFAHVNDIDLIAYNHRLFEAVHVDKIDIETPETLAAYVADLVDPVAYLKSLQDGTFKDVQEQGDAYADHEQAVWFLPALRMNGKHLDAVGGVGVSEDAVRTFLNDAKRRANDADSLSEAAPA